MKNSQARDSAVGDGQAQVRDRALAGLSSIYLINFQRVIL